jgi:hypothetical protein
MKYAEVRYTGPMNSKNVRGPSGETYRLTNPMGGTPSPVGVSSMRDLAHFERNGSVYDVDWTPTGEIARRLKDPVKSAADVLTEVGYHEKKRIAKALGAETSSHPTQEELNEELEPVVQDLQRQMEI